MNSTTPHSPRARTRRAILDAVADVIIDGNDIGFSVQAVADRAGLTHRTVYNHFPTREALCEGFSQYVDELLASGGATDPSSHLLSSRTTSLGESFSGAADALYRMLGRQERYARAYVMLMIGNRRPVETWRHRTHEFEKLIARRTDACCPLTPRQLTAAIRLFASSLGWHLLTEQCGLSTGEAAATSAWATRVLLDAATPRPAKSSSRKARRGATSRRRP